MTTYTAPPDQTGLILNNGDVLNVNGGGIATATTINDGGEVSVFRRGKTIDTTLDNGGREDVLGGGTAVDTTIDSGGSQDVSVGGIAVNTLISGGSEVVRGKADVTTINNGGHLSLNQGMTDHTTINSGGVEIVNAMGGRTEARHTTVNTGGLLDIFSGSAGFTTINDGGLVTGTAGNIVDTRINSGGVLDAKAGVIVTGLTFGGVDHGVGGLLKLGNPADLRLSAHGPLHNWQVGDVIDLVNTQVTSVSETPDGRLHKVTVKYGNDQTVTYMLSGQEKDTHVAFQSDGHGGTDLILVPVVGVHDHLG